MRHVHIVLQSGTAIAGRLVAFAAVLIVASALESRAEGAPSMPPGADIKTMCGSKPAVVALADGFGGNTWRRETLAEIKDEASKCPNVTKVLYADAQGDPAKANSDINSLVAQGVNVLIVFPDFGDATLPALRAATEAGVTVVAYNSKLSGKDGEDYAANVYQDLDAGVKKWVAWMDKNIKEGTVLYFGGLAGNSFSQSIMDDLNKDIAPYPKLKLLENQFIATGWATAEAEKATAGVIAKYGKVDVIVTDFGPVTLGVIKGFQQAGLKVPAMVGLGNNNEVNCLWADAKAKGQAWPYMTLEGTTTMVRYGLRRGLSAYEGTKDPDPMGVATYVFADSFAGIDPKCDHAAPLDADLSGFLTPEQLKQVFKQ